MSQDISVKLSAKDIQGRGLSKNDFTDTYKGSVDSTSIKLYQVERDSLYMDLLTESTTATSLNGATVTQTPPAILIPNGQTGRSSAITKTIPLSSHLNWTVGKTVRLYIIFIESVFNTSGSRVSIKLNVNRGAGFIANQEGTVIRERVVDNTSIVKAYFDYTIQSTDISLQPLIQIFTSAPVNSSGVSINFTLKGMYSQISNSGVETNPATEKINSLAVRATNIEAQIATMPAPTTETILTVSPDGTKMFLSPALANASIADSTTFKRYRIIIYPGVYPTTEVIIKPFTVWEGLSRDLCYIKGEMSDNSTDSQITNTSTIWLKKTSGIRNIKITAKNMRYAVHSEDSGLAPDAVHDIYNCYIEHYGNQGAIDWRTANPGSGLSPANVWAQPRPWGYGSSSGLIENYDNSTFVSPREAYYAHNNKEFAKPNINTATNCRFMSNYGFGKVIEAVNLGSGTQDVVDLRNCDFSAGFIQYSDTPWSYTDSSKQYANRAEFSTFVSGHRSPLGYRDITRGRALRIVSNNISGSSSVRVSGTAASVLFGQAIERDFGFGVKGYIYGYWDISGSLVGSPENITVNNTIGRRLGDCTAVNKTLSVSLNGGGAIDIVFNLNYTAVSNATIISDVNTALGANAFADEYNPATWEYYPEMYGKQITVSNNSSTKTIPAWSPCVLDTNKNNVRVMQPSDAADKFIGFNPFAIVPKGINRVLTEGYLQKIQAAGLPSATIVYNSDISMSATEGIVEVSSLKVIGKGVSTDWFYFKGNV